MISCNVIKINQKKKINQKSTCESVLMHTPSATTSVDVQKWFNINIIMDNGSFPPQIPSVLMSAVSPSKML